MTEIIGRVGWRNFVTSSTTLWNGLTNYYSGDNTTNDSKGTSNVTLTNGATYSIGKINNGFSFDGVNDALVLTPNPLIGGIATDLYKSFSISCWIKPGSLSGGIFNTQHVDDGYRLLLLGDGRLFYRGFYSNGGYGADDIYTSNCIAIGNSYHIAVIHENGVGTKIYCNDILVGSSSSTGKQFYSSSATFRIGGDPIRGYMGNFNGSIDEFGLWNRAISLSEKTELYNAGAGKQYVAPTPTYTTRTQALIAATGLTDTDKINAINTFDTGLISNNLPFGANDALYLGFLGDSLKNKYNFIDTTKYPLTFLGGWDFTNGMKGNGSNAYAKTGWIPSTLASSGSSYGVYSRQSVATNHSLLSSYTGAATGYFGAIGKSSNSIDFYNQSGGAGSTANSLPRTNRFIQSSKSFSSLTQNISVDTTQIALSMGSSSLSSREVYISTFNNGGPTNGYYANEDLCCIYLSSQVFTTSQQLILNGLVNTLLTTLGLNV